MSKIEVLRVPDDIQSDSLPDGSLILIMRSRVAQIEVLPDEKPALLAALLEDARAYKVSIKLGKMGFGGGKGKLWFLPIPEDTP